MPTESDHNPTPTGQKRSLLALAATATGVTGLALVRWLRGRRALPVDEPDSSGHIQPPDLSPEVLPQQSPSPVDKTPALSRWTLARTVTGLACLILAQSLLLGSRNPIIPLILYIVGFVALLSLLNRPHGTIPNRPLRLTDGVAVVGFMAAAALIFLTTPTPGVTQINGLFWILILVPAVYLVGWLVDGPQTGFFAAGFVAVSLWTLALGKARDDFCITAAAAGAIFLAGLFVSGTVRRPIGIVSAVVLGALGLSFAPALVVLLLLVLPGLILFDSHQRWQRIAGSALLVMVAGAFVFLVMCPNVLQSIPDNYHERFGFSPAVAASDALFSSLMLFNLTSDPDPLHGIVNRPVFDPILAAFFLVGLFGLVWRVYHERRWKDGLLLAAVVIAMLPVTQEIIPPIYYPDLQLAALALPVAVVIAAWGANRIAAQFRVLWGSRGQMLAVGLFLLALLVIANDTYHQYANISVPAYERAMHMSAEFNTGN